jgi:lysyl-tRNA synthetase class 2
MDEVIALVRYCLPEFSFCESRVSYRELIRGYTGLDSATSTDEALSEFIRSQKLEIPELSRAEMLDLIISHFIQPALPQDGLTLVFNYPSEQAALARIRPGKPPVAERFELFLGQAELANGYQELTDAKEQEARFRHENQQREKRGQDAVPIDEHLLEALATGLPECSGVALGIDRLLMYQLAANSISEVLAIHDEIT